MINDASIYSTILLFVALLPQLLYFLIKGKKNLPSELYHGRYLSYALVSLFAFVATLVLVLFFSNSYGVIARLLGWLIVSHSLIALILISWILFIMHGYELRYMFKKIVVPGHMNALIALVFWTTILFSLNYWAMIPCAIYTLFSMMWAYKAYKITKPAIDENIPLREDDEY